VKITPHSSKGATVAIRYKTPPQNKKIRERLMGIRRVAGFT
jgi:hypothetical protein